MSDRFNSNEEKKKITKLFGTPIVGDVEEKFPEFYVLPKQTDVTPLEFNQLLQKFRITSYKPSGIPALVSEDVTGLINPQLNQLVEARDGKAMLPVGETEFLPRYTPKHTASNYDLRLYKQILFQWIEHPFYEKFEKVIGELLSIPNNYVFSSGTYAGQISRLRGMYDVADGTNGKNKPKPVTEMLPFGVSATAGSSLEAVAQILEFYLPLNTVEDAFDGNFPGLFYKPSYFASMDPDDDFDYLPKIGATKIAGLPYVGKTKNETILEALVLSDLFVQNVADIIAMTPAEGNNPIQGYNIPHAQTQIKQNEKPREAVEKLLRDFWYMAAGQFFPKAERYLIDDIEKKTRNIFAMAFPTHIIASLIAQPVLDKSPNAVQVDTPSLYAFSPFHGGLDTIINKYIVNPAQSTSLIYADNWYIIYVEEDGTKTYFSIDQEKAEAQAQLDDFRACGYYLLTRGHLSREGEPAFNLTWLYIATTLLPVMFHNPTAILQNQQFLIKGMGSGITWTFLINHIRSAMIDDKWRRVGMPRPGSKAWTDKVITPCGCNLKIELTVEDVVGKLEALKISTPESGYFQVNSPGKPSDEPTPYVGLDLLGWGAAWSRLGEMYVPVLENERLFKSLMLPTKDDRHDYKDKPWQKYTYEVARSEAMRMVGGWMYAPVDAALRNQANDARKKLIRMKHLTRTELEEAFRTTEFGAEFDLDGINLVKEVDYLDFLNLNDFKETPPVLPYIKNRTWGVNLIAPPPRSNVIPGASFMANLKIDDWLISRNLLGQTLTGSDLNSFLASKEYAQAVAELQTIKLYIRNKTDVPSTKPIREKEHSKLVDPYASYKLHSDHMATGTTLEKAGGGATPNVRNMLSKNQRRKINARATQLTDNPVPNDLIEGKDIKGNSALILKPTPPVPAPRLSRAAPVKSEPQQAQYTEPTPKPKEPRTITQIIPHDQVPRDQRKVFVAKPKPKNLSTTTAANMRPSDLAQHLKVYYDYYGPSAYYKIIFDKLGELESKQVQDHLEHLGGDELLDKITAQL